MHVHCTEFDLARTWYYILICSKTHSNYRINQLIKQPHTLQKELAIHIKQSPLTCPKNPAISVFRKPFTFLFATRELNKVEQCRMAQGIQRGCIYSAHPSYTLASYYSIFGERNLPSWILFTFFQPRNCLFPRFEVNICSCENTQSLP